MLKKDFTDSSFYFINGTRLMGSLFQKTLYFKKYFPFGLFVACLFTKN